MFCFYTHLVIYYTVFFYTHQVYFYTQYVVYTVCVKNHDLHYFVAKSVLSIFMRFWVLNFVSKNLARVKKMTNMRYVYPSHSQENDWTQVWKKRLKQIYTKAPLQGQTTAMVSVSGEILEILGIGGSGKFLKSKWDVDSKREVLSSIHNGGSCPWLLSWTAQ